MEGTFHAKALTWWLESKNCVARGVKVLGEHLWVMLYNVCTCTASHHYDLTLYLLNAFGADIGDTQVASNISNIYLEQIHAYLDSVFGIMVLHGKHPKTD